MLARRLLSSEACMQVQDSEVQGQGTQRDLLTLLLEEKREDSTPAFSQREVHDEVTQPPGHVASCSREEPFRPS